jgi:hypothetical protein
MSEMNNRSEHLSVQQLDRILLDMMNVLRTKADTIDLAGVDIDALVQRARYRRVGTVISGKLSSFQHANRQIRDETRKMLRTSAMYDCVLAQAATNLSCSFRESNIKYIVYKGPVLWRALNTTGPFKVSDDIDVLVAGEDIEQASRILNSMGYRCCEVKGSEATYTSEGRPAVDLHWGLLTVSTWAEKLSAFVSNALERRVYIDLEGTSLPTFSPTDMVLSLTLHAGCHHICMSWVQIYEIALCTAAWRKEIDWEYILNAANAVGLKNALYGPLFLASGKFGALVPEEIIDRITLPVSKQGLVLIAKAAFEGRIRTYQTYRIARTMWNLILQSSPAGLVSWAQKWLAHQSNKRRKIDVLNAENP